MLLVLAQRLELGDRVRVPRVLGDDLLELIDGAIGLTELEVQPRERETVGDALRRRVGKLGAAAG